jgi:hypothetical protein
MYRNTYYRRKPLIIVSSNTQYTVAGNIMRQNKAKKSIYLFIFLLALVIILPQVQALHSASQTVASSGTINNNPHTIGLNYASLYWEYSPTLTTSTVLNRDFSLFKADGISVISLPLYWYRLEGNTKGSYNGTDSNGIYGDAFLSNVKQVISVANKYGIKVLIDIHTLWGTDSYWCTPAYVVDPYTGLNDGLSIVRSPQMEQAFINMFNNTVQYLKGTPGIWAWSILNEPWYWGLTANQHDFITSNGQTQQQNFVSLIQTLSSIVKANNAGLVTVKFISVDEYASNGIKNIFTNDWNMNPQIINALNFVSFDCYQTYPQLESTWKTMAASNVNSCVQMNKPVYITEFGVSSNNDTQQASGMTDLVTFFKTLPVQGWMAWCWEGDQAPPSWSQNPCLFDQGYNLCASPNGTPRPAYYSMLQ